MQEDVETLYSLLNNNNNNLNSLLVGHLVQSLAKLTKKYKEIFMVGFILLSKQKLRTSQWNIKSHHVVTWQLEHDWILKMEAVSSPETFVNIGRSIPPNIPEEFDVK